MNLPAAFEEKMRALLGDEFDEYLACYEEPRILWHASEYRQDLGRRV